MIWFTGPASVRQSHLRLDLSADCIGLSSVNGTSAKAGTFATGEPGDHEGEGADILDRDTLGERVAAAFVGEAAERAPHRGIELGLDTDDFSRHVALYLPLN